MEDMNIFNSLDMENFMESKKMSFFYNLCARAVFGKDGSLTWFGWLCLLGAGILAGAVISMLQGCVNVYTRCPTTTHVRIERCYQCTGEAAGMSLIAAFPQMISDSPGDHGFIIENVITIPIGCIGLCDTACEAVLDTAFLPVDYALSRYRSRGVEK